MNSLIPLLVLCVALGSCEKKPVTTDVSITPVSLAETRSILLKLRWSLPLEETQTSQDDCRSFQASLPRHYVQGFVTVPEDYSNPGARQIKVFYYGRLENGKDPIVFFNGGPASDSHGSSNLLNKIPQAQDLSFIFIDQRGTGCSEAFPQAPATIENVQRLTRYTTAEIARDSEVIRVQLLQTLRQIRELIGDDLCFNDGASRICGAKVMDAATIVLGFSNNWDYLHRTLSNILLKSDQLNQPALESFVRTFVFGVYNANMLAASVISLVELSNGSSDAESCKKVNDKLEADGEHPQDWLINECRLLIGLANEQWDSLLSTIKINSSMTPGEFKTALDGHPELPFFLYSGEKDVFVPIETFAEEQATLGKRITYRQFPNSGHEGFYTEQKIWDDILAVE